jgi:hypothetical protein
MKQSVLSKQVGFSIPKKWKLELFLSQKFSGGQSSELTITDGKRVMLKNQQQSPLPLAISSNLHCLNSHAFCASGQPKSLLPNLK